MWVVRPDGRTVTVHRPDHSAVVFSVNNTLGSGDAGFAVEGFSLPVAEIFA